MREQLDALVLGLPWQHRHIGEAPRHRFDLTEAQAIGASAAAIRLPIATMRVKSLHGSSEP